MASYHYYSSVYGCTVQVRDGWHRFHSMNAQYQYGKFPHPNYDGEYQERFDFISYATPICHVLYESRHDSWTIDVNRAYFDCSPSTSRQFNRWLRENDIPVTLYDLKRFDRNVEYENHSYIDVSDNVCVFWRESDSIERMF